MRADAEARRLYGLPLEDFVRERNHAAREARAAGDRDAAAAIAGLPKPSVAAWAVNQLARQERRDVDLLLDSGKRLLDAQRTSLERGGRGDLDKARSSLDQAVSRLGGAAKRILGDRATENTLARVADTLRSATLSPRGRELLATGSFTREMSGTGWDILESLAPPEKQEPRQPAADRTDGKAQAVREARERLKQARGARSDAARRLQDAERDLKRAQTALERASSARDDALSQLEARDAALDQAEKALRAAREP